ncbi:MAG: hypothetical protein WC663_05540 [Patescibacteria group bacterium]|jgi:hypothetical protein
MKKIFKTYKKFEKANLLQLSSFFLGFAVGKNKDKKIRPFFKNAYIVIKENKGILYWRKENFEKAILVLNNLIEKKPKYNSELLKKIEKKAKEIKRITAKIAKMKLNKKSNQEIAKFVQVLYNIKVEWADLLFIPNILVMEQKPSKFEILAIEIENRINILMDSIIKEISRRTFYSVSQLYFALPIEIKDIINKKGLKRYELDNRSKLCLIEVNRNGKLKVISGIEAKNIIKKYKTIL